MASGSSNYIVYVPKPNGLAFAFETSSKTDRAEIERQISVREPSTIPGEISYLVLPDDTARNLEQAKKVARMHGLHYISPEFIRQARADNPEASMPDIQQAFDQSRREAMGDFAVPQAEGAQDRFPWAHGKETAIQNLYDAIFGGPEQD